MEVSKMGKTTERELKIQQEMKKVEAFLQKAKNDFGENNVTYFKGDDGSTIIRISNSKKTLTRKEHKTPEFLRKDGD